MAYISRVSSGRVSGGHIILHCDYDDVQRTAEKTMATNLNAPARLSYLDGLRGWAALVVVVFHATWETFGAYLPPVRTRYASLANDGALAVHVFFVISGIVLSYGVLRTGDMRRVQRMALARYPRLLVPVACVATFGFIGLELGLFANRAAGLLVGREDWLSLLYERMPSVGSLVRWSIWDVWFNYNQRQSYGPFLWTMPLELLGSFVLFSVLYISGGSRSKRYLYYGALFVYGWAVQGYLLPFLYGLLLAEAMLSNLPDRVPFANIAGLGLFALGCVGSVVMRNAYDVHEYGVLAGLVVAGCVLSPTLRRLLETRLSRWLGHVSFPLYLVHSLVLSSISSWLIVWLAPHETHWTVFAVVAPTTIALSLVMAQLFSPVERLAVHTSHAFAEAVMSGLWR